MMGKKKVTRKAVSKQPTEEERGKELFLAQHLVARRYWDDKKATVNDALEEVSYDTHCLLQILEGMAVTIYEYGVEPSGSSEEPSSSQVFSGIYETLKILIPRMRDRLERAEDSFTGHLPARKQGGRP
jgi:hypothetical protein